MLQVKLNTKEAERKLMQIPSKIEANVRDSAYSIQETVAETTTPKVPIWQGTLRKSIFSESSPSFYLTERGLTETVVYDAWNPRTQFHYARLRYLNNRTGEVAWLEKGMKEAEPLIERVLLDAVKRGVEG